MPNTIVGYSSVSPGCALHAFLLPQCSLPIIVIPSSSLMLISSGMLRAPAFGLRHLSFSKSLILICTRRSCFVRLYSNFLFGIFLFLHASISMMDIFLHGIFAFFILVFKTFLFACAYMRAYMHSMHACAIAFAFFLWTFLCVRVAAWAKGSRILRRFGQLHARLLALTSVGIHAAHGHAARGTHCCTCHGILFATACLHGVRHTATCHGAHFCVPRACMQRAQHAIALCARTMPFCATFGVCHTHCACPYTPSYLDL